MKCFVFAGNLRLHQDSQIMRSSAKTKTTKHLNPLRARHDCNIVFGVLFVHSYQAIENETSEETSKFANVRPQMKPKKCE